MENVLSRVSADGIEQTPQWKSKPLDKPMVYCYYEENGSTASFAGLRNRENDNF